MRFLPVILGALLAPTNAVSQNPTSLDPIVVTATGAAHPLSEAIPSTQVITRADIERLQANDLVDLLRGIAGVDVVRNGGPGSAASVFIRGAESNHTLFIVDGVRYTTETFLGAQVQNLAPGMIERIEIVRGPRSARWGSDAIGGVVHIITRRARAGPHASTILRAGSHGTADGAGQLSWGGTHGTLLVGAQAQRYDGYPPQQSGGNDRGHEAGNLLLKGRTALPGPVQLGARHLRAAGVNEFVQFGEERSQSFRNQITGVTADVALLEQWTAGLVLSEARDALVQREPDDPARPDRFSETDVRRRSAVLESAVTWSGLNFILGADLGTSDIHSVFYSEFGDSVTRDHTERHSAFVQVQLGLGPADLVVALRRSEHDAFPGATTGNFEVGIPLWVGARLGLAVGNGYKEPELTDLFGPFGNPGLEPERSRSAELNLRQALGESQVITVAAFENRVDDLIAFDLAGLVNVDRTRTRGVEAGWHYAGPRWQSRVTAAHQDPKDATTGNRLARRSGTSLGAVATVRAWRLEPGLELQASGARRDANGARMAGYALWHARLGVPLPGGWHLGLRVENLLDADYELVDGFRPPGRGGTLSLRASF